MIFRDLEGNFYSISEEVLSKHIIHEELPENVELAGSQSHWTSSAKTAASYNYTAPESAASYNYTAPESAASYNYTAPAMVS
ncbi:MAG: hypothetical protein RMY62_017610 [Nostoc sp. ZfuVER08]|nr:hypothetical protein [Nostoc sp. ZfuVER08]